MKTKTIVTLDAAELLEIIEEYIVDVVRTQHDGSDSVEVKFKIGYQRSGDGDGARGPAFLEGAEITLKSE